MRGGRRLPVPEAARQRRRRTGDVVLVGDAPPKRGKTRAYYRVRCEVCGRERVVDGAVWQSGRVGCAHGKHTTNRTHGRSATAEYDAWQNLTARHRRALTGALVGGTKRDAARLCARWLQFEAWFADVGARPPVNEAGRAPTFRRLIRALPFSCGLCAECGAQGWKRNGRWTFSRRQKG